jgi:hypothetical protein
MLTTVPAALYSAYDYEGKTISITAVGFTSAKIVPTDVGYTALAVTVSVEDANIRVRIDGTDPTSSEGHLIEAGSIFYIYGTEDIIRARFIRAGTSDAKIKVTFMA